jgi:NADH-quinone oxidoreductase subunit N
MLASMLGQTGSTFGFDVEWFAMSPMLVLLGGAMFLLVSSVLVPSLYRPNGMAALVTAITGGAAGTMAFFLWDDVRDGGAQSLMGGALGLDGFALFITITICASVILSALFIDDYLRREDLDGVELYALLLLSAIGGVIMASSNDLIVLFLGLETLSIALYVMAGSHMKRIESQESALKYFVLGGVASAIFLYGVALIYGGIGSTSLLKIDELLDRAVLTDNRLVSAGLALMLMGLAFKVAAAPFHVWTPDVYQGAPTPVTGFMASAAKASGFAALLRVFYLAFPSYSSDWKPVVWVLAVATLAVGSILAVVQTDVKRMLAYSSISHAGYILVGVYVGNADGTSASLFYLLAYTFMVLGSFGVVGLVSRTGDRRTSLDDFRGLAKHQPVLAYMFVVFLLGQAGVPLTSGFIAKLGVISAAAEDKAYVLAVIAMVASAVAVYLYLRIIVSMFMSDGDGVSDPAVRLPVSASLGLAIAFAFTLVVGFLPGEFLEFARDAVPGLLAAN